jgi:hypothetical protein
MVYRVKHADEPYPQLDAPLSGMAFHCLLTEIEFYPAGRAGIIANFIQTQENRVLRRFATLAAEHGFPSVCRRTVKIRSKLEVVGGFLLMKSKHSEFHAKK